jgi:hypothetical protein
MTKLIRVRLEAHGDDQEQLRTFLLEIWERAHQDGNGQAAWEVEDERIVSSANGFWGRLTMRRKGEHGSDEQL